MQSRESLGKLVLQVAHTCNLACPYCCSDRGLWGAPTQGLMPASVAVQAIREFAKCYTGIDAIYFFGGEPTLNLDAIEASLDCIDQLLDSGGLAARPITSLTSNGYKISNRLISLLKDRSLSISISLDGPPDINDRLRPLATGRATTERVMENIRSLRAETSQPARIDLTYTSLHLSSQRSLFSMLEYLFQETGVNRYIAEPAFDTSKNLHFDPLNRNADLVGAQLEDTIRKSMMQMRERAEPIIYERILHYINRLLDPFEPDFCPATTRYFTVAAGGTIYPCQNLPETSAYALGSIADIPGMLLGLETKRIVGEIRQANLSASKQLKGSWYANGCKVCPAFNISETRSPACHHGLRFNLHARLRKAFAEELLDIARDPEAYTIFQRNCLVHTFRTTRKDAMSSAPSPRALDDLSATRA